MQRMKGNLFFAFFFSKSVFEGTQAVPIALSVVILFQTFRFTVRAFLATQTYGLFCSLRTERKNSTL